MLMIHLSLFYKHKFSIRYFSHKNCQMSIYWHPSEKLHGVLNPARNKIF